MKKIDIFILMAFFMLVLVYAAVPTIPTYTAPSNGTTTQDTNMTLYCIGSSDGDGDDVVIEFVEPSDTSDTYADFLFESGTFPSATDSSGNGRTATITTGVYNITNYRYGVRALTLYEGGYFTFDDLGTNYNMTTLTDWSVSFWMNTNSYEVETKILTTGDTSSNWRLVIQEDILKLIHSDQATYTTGANVSNGSWQNIVVTMDGSEDNFTVWVNNVSKANHIFSAEGNEIDKFQFDSGTATFDNIKFYDEKISDETISDIFANTFSNWTILQNDTGTSYNWSGLSAGTKYIWNCRACDDNSGCSAYAGPFHFNVTSLDLNVTLYDEETLDALTNTNTSLDLISEEGDTIKNYSSTNGNISMTNLTSGSYTLRYSSDNHYERRYEFTLDESTSAYQKFYLLNKSNTNAVNITATVITQLNEKLEGAVIEVKRLSMDNQTYLTVDRAKTNFEGVANYIAVVTNDYYKFSVEYPVGTTLLTTSPTYIEDTEMSFIVDTGTDPTELHYNLENIESNLTYLNASHSFQWKYIDSDGIGTKYCLTIFNSTVIKEYETNTTCLTSNFGTIEIAVPVVNGTTYRAEGVVTVNSIDYTLDTLVHQFQTIAESWKELGLFIVLLLTIGLVLTVVWSPVVALLLTPLPLLFASVIGIVAIQTGIVLAVTLAFWILAMLIGRRG